ncbi:MAG: cytochrome c maturation protein CcmE [Pseudomonadales bacterium]|nr:cytochrome c maturation protein CcmE [Pseudomonadales bacterium]
MNPKRKQRLIIVLGIVAGVSVAAAFMGVALKENINLYFSPTDIAAGKAPLNRRIRVGGLVVAGSLKRGEQLDVSFDVTDNVESLTIRYDGILPDLFREGQGIIANGKLTASGVVVADEVLAKHDEEYMPPEVQDSLDKAEAKKLASAKDNRY